MKRQPSKGIKKNGAAESDGLPMLKCRYCKVRFRPLRKTQRFCQDAHRKLFHRYGGLAYDKMREQIVKDVLREIRGLLLLQEKCESCKGQGGECGRCSGAGAAPTAFGASIVAFLRRCPVSDSRSHAATISQS
jgi:hypothetical protein